MKLTLEQRTIVLKAAALIKDEGNWCQGTYALNQDGSECDPLDPNAKRFSATGALVRATFESIKGNRHFVLGVLHDIRRQAFPWDLSRQNDILGHQEVRVLPHHIERFELVFAYAP